MARTLVSYVLYLAPTRPSMKWGVPIEGVVINVCVWFLVGYCLIPRGVQYTAALWALGFPSHYAMRFHADKNPGFYRELRMFFLTRLSIIGGTLFALPPFWRKGQRRPSSV